MTKDIITFDQAAKRLVDNGYLPIPIFPNKKSSVDKWPSFRLKPSDERRYSGYGVGLLTGQGDYPLIVLDLDSKDPWIRQQFDKKLSAYACLIREWDDPKAQYFFRAEVAGLPRILSKEYDDGRFQELKPDDRKKHKEIYHRLEIRGAGNQSVIFGTHPIAKKPCRWVDSYGGPLGKAACDLPILPMTEAEELLKFFEDLCEKGKQWKESDSGQQAGPKAGQEIDSFAYAVEKANRPEIGLAEAKKYLDLLPEKTCDDRNSWLEIGMGLHFQFDACEEAYELFDRWSRNSAKYAGPDDTQRVWDSFGKQVSRPITFRTILDLANKELKRREIEEKKLNLSSSIAGVKACLDQYAVQDVLKHTHVTDSIDRDKLVRVAREKIKELSGELPSVATVRSFFPAPQRQTPYAFSQDGNRDRFVDQYKGELIYVENLNKWYFWNGLVWDEFSQAMAIELASKTIRRIIDEAALYRQNPELQKSLMKHSIASQTYDSYRKIVDLAKGDEKIRIAKGESLDALSGYIAVENGEIDLHSQKLIQPRREHFITKKCNVKYDPSAECPLWEKTLAGSLGSQDRVDYLQRCCGYMLLGKPSEDAFLVLLGSGGNGKSTVTNTICNILGDYAYRAPASCFVRSKHDIENGSARARPELVNMLGARFVLAQEPDKGHYLDEAVIKPLTGRDGFPARNMYANTFINVTIRGLLVISANDMPNIRDTQASMRRRMQILHFDRCFEGKAEKDSLLEVKLTKEYPGIFNWMLKGVTAYLKEGLNPPKEDTERTKEFIDDAAYEADYTTRFIEEFFVRDPQSWCAVAEVNKAWSEFAISNNIPHSEAGHTKGSRRIRALRDENGERVFSEASNPGKLKGKYFKGLRLKPKDPIFNG